MDGLSQSSSSSSFVLVRFSGDRSEPSAAHFSIHPSSIVANHASPNRGRPRGRFGVLNTYLRVVQRRLPADLYLCCALYWSTAFWIWAHAASGVRVPRTTESWAWKNAFTSSCGSAWSVGR
jgi:hypothetical protein